MRISDWSSDVCSSDLTLEEAQAEVLKELEQQRAELDQLTQRVIERGLASWGGSQSGKGGALILRGQSQLLEDVNALEDLERIRQLFNLLETKEDRKSTRLNSSH